MAYGAYTFNKIQLGRESSAGTPVAATSIWRGPAIDIEEIGNFAFVEEDVGLLLATGNQYQASKQAQIAFPATAMTFEQVLHILEAGIEADTPSGGGPYTYNYEFPYSTTLNTIKTYTIESGNAVAGDVNEMEYAFVTDFTFAGAINEPWTMEATWVGRQKSTASFTGALSLPSVEEVMFNNTSLYIDDSGGSIGSTGMTGVLTAASINVATGIQPVFVPDSELYFASHKFVRPSVTGTITLELENDSGHVAAERAKYAARSLRLIRLTADGTSSRAVTFDVCAYYTGVDTYANADGDTVVTFNWEGRYSSTDSLYFEVAVVNNLSAVP